MIVLSPDIISAICRLLSARDVRALMITCREMRARVSPLTELRISSRALKIPSGPAMVCVTTSMHKLGIDVSRNIKIVDLNVKMTPPAVPIDYTGRIVISHGGYTYHIYMCDGYVDKYVKIGADHSSTNYIIWGRLYKTHFVDTINSVCRI